MSLLVHEFQDYKLLDFYWTVCTNAAAVVAAAAVK
jgi:hypothetical protein